ncbi:MAG: hypothetical protein ACXQTS_03945 [Candidatus Methanospirareceae archaeon]
MKEIPIPVKLWQAAFLLDAIAEYLALKDMPGSYEKVIICWIFFLTSLIIVSLEYPR